MAVGGSGGAGRGPAAGHGEQGEDEQRGEDAGGGGEGAGVAVDEAGGRGQIPGDGFTDEQIAAAVDEAGYALA